MSMEPTYQVWQHTVTAERWLVRIERDTLTGLFGPLPAGTAPDPTTVEFEDHPDDLEWVYRSTESFRVAR